MIQGLWVMVPVIFQASTLQPSWESGLQGLDLEMLKGFVPALGWDSRKG